MKGIVLKQYEAAALAAGKSVMIWRAIKWPVKSALNSGSQRLYFERDVKHMQAVLHTGLKRPHPHDQFLPFPVGVPLFGKETWGRHDVIHSAGGCQIAYKSTDASPEFTDSEQCLPRRPFKWRSSTHMPQWASRITLTLSDVRVRKPCDVTEEEAKAMGILKYPWLATMLNPDTMKIETDDRHCRRVFGEIFRTQYGSDKWNLYHFSALATPMNQPS